jgi:hypothetical protein
LNALALLGNFSIRLGGVDGRLAESMSVGLWLGSIPPNKREMLKKERLPQTAAPNTVSEGPYYGI